MNAPKRRGRPPKQWQPEIIEAGTVTVAIPDWADFLRYVQANGDEIVKAQYPYERVPMPMPFAGVTIDTIWRGVPVVDGERVRLMTADSTWYDYGAQI